MIIQKQWFTCLLCASLAMGMMSAVPGSSVCMRMQCICVRGHESHHIWSVCVCVLLSCWCVSVQGPVISAEQSGGVSVGFMQGILESPADKEFDGNWTVVDVRDVAAAHILAAEKQTAKGRCDSSVAQQ